MHDGFHLSQGHVATGGDFIVNPPHGAQLFRHRAHRE
jgi:hypothetical protein